MSTILTDDEIQAKGRNGFGIDPILDGNLMKFARAVEAAVLAKLARQEPALLVRCELPQHKGQWMAEDGRRFLLSDPAPQHDDRQRVPANKANNEFNRVIQHAITLGSEAASFLRCWNEGNWDGCREFDFEPAPPYEIEDQADRQRVPEGHVLVPVEPTIEMLEAMHTENLTFYASEQREAYAAMLAAAPEAPALKHVPLTDERIIEVLGDTKHSQITAVRALIAESHAAPEAPAQAKEISPEFTDTARAALLWVLWHHQGGSSDVGQPVRFALGMGQYEKMNAHQVREAKRWAALNPKPTPEAPAQASAVDERAAFEAWYSQNAFDFERDPIGSRECGLQWEAWQARAALAQKGGK